MSTLGRHFRADKAFVLTFILQRSSRSANTSKDVIVILSVVTMSTEVTAPKLSEAIKHDSRAAPRATGQFEDCTPCRLIGEVSLFIGESPFTDEI